MKTTNVGACCRRVRPHHIHKHAPNDTYTNELTDGQMSTLRTKSRMRHDDYEMSCSLCRQNIAIVYLNETYEDPSNSSTVRHFFHLKLARDGQLNSGEGRKRSNKTKHYIRYTFSRSIIFSKRQKLLILYRLFGSYKMTNIIFPMIFILVFQRNIVSMHIAYPVNSQESGSVSRRNNRLRDLRDGQPRNRGWILGRSNTFCTEPGPTQRPT
jgi:hypothetical protein